MSDAADPIPAGFPPLRVSIHGLILGLVAFATLLPLAIPTDLLLLASVVPLVIFFPGPVLAAVTDCRAMLLIGLATVSWAANGATSSDLGYLIRLAAGVVVGGAARAVYVPTQSRSTHVLFGLATLGGLACVLPWTNALVARFVFSMPLAIWCLGEVRRRPHYLAGAAFGVLVMLLTNSKTWFATMLAPIVLWSALTFAPAGKARLRIFRLFFALALGLPVFAGALFYLNPSRFLDLFSPSQSLSTMARVELGLTGWRAALDRPVVGHGPRGVNAWAVYTRYYGGEYLQPLVDAGLGQQHDYNMGNGASSGTHNLYLDVAASYGFPMLALVIGLTVGGFRRAMRARDGLLLVAVVFVTIVGLNWQLMAVGFGTALFTFATGVGAHRAAAAAPPETA
jgi:hypothetical protein